MKSTLTCNPSISIDVSSSMNFKMRMGRPIHLRLPDRERLHVVIDKETSRTIDKEPKYGLDFSERESRPVLEVPS